MLTITADHAKASLFKSLKPEEQSIIGRVIYAGMKMLFDQTMNDKVVEGLKQAVEGKGMDVADALGIGVGHTLVIMYNESKGTMPLGALLPAGYVLLAKMFEFVNETKMFPVTDEDFGQAMQMTNAVINRTFNPDHNKDLVEQGKSAISQGQQTEQQAQPAGLLAQPQGAA
jgi:hypothetical protein